jgi:uncharacterized protein (DUF983 family)
MSSITCPRCGSPVPLRRFFNAAGKPFCTRCGWNLDRAEAALAGKGTLVKLLPVGMVAAGLFGVIVATRANSPGIFIVPALFVLVALIPLCSYFSVRKAVAEAKSTVNPSLALTEPPIDPGLQRLQSLPRPRRVGFRFQGNLAAVAAMLVIAILLAFGVFALTARKGPAIPDRASTVPLLLPLLFLLTFVVVVMAIPFVRDRRSMPLLRDGELAFGRVTSQQTIQQGKASYSRIDYEFQTNTGQTVCNSVRDLTSTLFEDMTIPVFYDPLDSSKNITPCATSLKIAENPF